MKLSCIQHKAFDIYNYNDYLDRVSKMIREAAYVGSKLIVLPECSFPAYIIQKELALLDILLENTKLISNAIGGLAKELGVYIVWGAIESFKNSIYNMAVLFNDEGEIINKVYKSNLWHFDEKVFNEGKGFRVVDTKLGKIGMIISSDALTPEIIRILKLKGAEIIIEISNLSTAGSYRSNLSNMQVDHLLITRAMENDIWVVMADKVGSELNCNTYTGKSCIISPLGEIIAMGSCDKEEVISGEIDLSIRATNMPLRRPDLYEIIHSPVNSTEIYRLMNTPIEPYMSEVFCGSIVFDYETEEQYMDKALNHLDNMGILDASLIVLPFAGNINGISKFIELIRTIINENTIVILPYFKHSNGYITKTAVVFGKHLFFGGIDKIHKESIDCGLNYGSQIEVINTTLANISIIFDGEILVPELTRCHMLMGSEVIVWIDTTNFDNKDMILKTRAVENKINFIRNTSCTNVNTSMMVNIDGVILASSFIGEEYSLSAQMIPCFSRFKSVVPGTNVVTTRKPKIYKELVI